MFALKRERSNMVTKDEFSKFERITTTPGTKEYDHQFQSQASSAIHRIARMTLVRVVCGVLTLIYLLAIAAGSTACLRSQINSGFNAWETLSQLAVIWLAWWLISMQGRIALHGEFDVGIGLFAPKQKTSNNQQ